MRIAGIDLSLTSTGICIDGSSQIISLNLRGAERLSTIAHKIIDICITNNVGLVVIEGYSYASQNSRAHSIGELGGCVRMLLWENNIPFVDVPPSIRAKFASGKGNSSKAIVIESVKKITGISFDGKGADDCCDAFVLEQIGLAKLGKQMYDWPEEGVLALSKIDWSALEKFDE